MEALRRLPVYCELRSRPSTNQVCVGEGMCGRGMCGQVYVWAGYVWAGVCVYGVLRHV